MTEITLRSANQIETTKRFLTKLQQLDEQLYLNGLTIVGMFQQHGERIYALSDDGVDTNRMCVKFTNGTSMRIGTRVADNIPCICSRFDGSFFNIDIVILPNHTPLDVANWLLGYVG